MILRRHLLGPAWAVLALGLLARATAAVEWVPATVELSDGSAVTGKACLTGDSLIIHNEAQARRYTVRTAEIAGIETAIEKQSMEAKWIFKESGLDDKIYTGETFPVRYYVTTVTFHDGRKLTGHIVPKTLYVESDGQRQRFILRRKDEGKVGEMLDDLLYVRSVTFSEAGSGARGTIEGTVIYAPGEKLQKVLAVNRDKLFSVVSGFNQVSGRFRIGDCTEGTYDLVIVTDRAVYVCFSRERDEGAGRLDADAVAEIQAWVEKLRDFFHTQKIAYAAGNEERAFALVMKERRGGTTLPGAELIRRCDVWAMHKPRDEWQIEKRFFVYRIVSEDLSPEPRRVVVLPALGGHRVSAQAQEIDLEIRLRPTEEEPIPPPKRAEAGKPESAEATDGE